MREFAIFGGSEITLEYYLIIFKPYKVQSIIANQWNYPSSYIIEDDEEFLDSKEVGEMDPATYFTETREVEVPKGIGLHIIDYLTITYNISYLSLRSL